MKLINVVTKTIVFISSLFLVITCAEQNESFQGYVEGELRYIASNFSGQLLQLNVRRGNKVKPKQSLFILEEQPEQSGYRVALNKVTSAKAQVNVLQSEIKLAQLRYDRRLKLRQKNYVSQEEVDIERNSLEVAKKKLDDALASEKAAKDDLARSTWQANKKHYDAPMEALVFDTYFKPGEFVPAGQPVLALLAIEDIKFVFFMSEYRYNTIKQGDRVAVSCDGCKQPLLGTIYYISPKPEFTQPQIYSEQTRHKLTFLIEAHPDSSTASQLHPGQPISVRLIH
jgi:HlyD family secretion protein